MRKFSIACRIRPGVLGAASLFLLLVLWTAASGSAQSNPAATPAGGARPVEGAVAEAAAAQSPDWSAEIGQINQYAEQVRQAWKVPGLSIAVVKDDRVILARGYGVRELGKPDPVDADTLFAIASNSKAFTTTALAILVDEGRLAWDDPVSRYLPEFQLNGAFETRELTVRDLVCHRSGLDTFSGDLLWYDTTYPRDEILRRVRQLKPVSSFRSRYGYQNLMFIAAGVVIERVSGEPWDRFVQTRILTPAGMARTTTSVLALKDNFAMPHNESMDQGLRVLPPGNVDNSWGACGLNSSATDMARWLRLQLGRGTLEGQTVFSAGQARELWNPQTLIPVSEKGAELYPSRHFMAYGLGFVLNDYAGRKVIGHSGGLDGMISQLAFVPEAGLGMVILTNSESPASRILRDRILDLFLGVQPLRDWNAEALAADVAGKQAAAAQWAAREAARLSGTAPSLPLEKYAGKWNCPMYGEVSTAVEEGRLVLRLGPAPNFVADLEHWQLNTFRIRWRPSVHYHFPPGFVNFQIDGNGEATELVIDQPNSDFWFYELDLKRVR